MKLKNLIYLALLIFLFVEVLIIFPSSIEHEADAPQLEDQKVDSKNKNKKEKPKRSSIAEQTMEGVHLIEAQGGQRDWELFAKVAEGSQQTGAWTLQEVEVKFYSQNKIEFVVTGLRGSIDGKSRDINVEGDVIVRSTNGYEYKTPAITYKASRRVLESPGPVLMKGPPENLSKGVDLRGTGLLVWVDTTQMLIKGPVSALRKMSDGKEFAVSSGQARVNGKSQEVQFEGQVGITYGDMFLQGPEANFIYSGANVLKEIQMLSGVKFNDEEKRASAQQLIFDLVKNKLDFKGQPKVQQGEDELSGEEIVFLDGGKKVKVERVRARVDNKKQ